MLPINVIPSDYKYQDHQTKRIHSITSYLNEALYTNDQYTQKNRISGLNILGSRFFRQWNTPPKSLPESFADNLSLASTNNLEYDNRKSGIQDPISFTRSRESDIPSLRKGLFNSLDNVKSSHLKKLKAITTKEQEFRRIVVIKNLPKCFGLNGVLSTIRGGPLERINFHPYRENPMLEIYFMFPNDAKKFFSYGESGLFVFNGVHLSVEWADETNTEDINIFHPQISKTLLNQINTGARRTLIFIRNGPKRSSNIGEVGTRYPDAKLNFSDFNINKVLYEFSSFGNIVDFTPIISQRLSFGIHFDDIRSAISLKKHCETPGTALYSKYKTWKICYGKDPSEAPCLSV